MTVHGIVESAIYVDDVHVSAKFYTSLFGWEQLILDERLGAFAVVPGQVFLIFRKGGTLSDMVTPGGVVPAHDGSGNLHFALGVSMDDLDAWIEKLKAHPIAVESIMQWASGGKSIYFRDPDNHLVELVTPGVWKNY